MAKKILFIFNPRSGKGIVNGKLFDIVDILTSVGYEVNIRPTQKKLDVYQYVLRKGSQFDMVIVSGGDGTLNECVNSLMMLPCQKRPIMAYIPAGSTNDFASTLKISKKPIAATRDIITGIHYNIDVGRFNDCHFIYVAAFGAFTEVAYDTPQHIKNSLGHLAYVLEGIKKLPNIKSYSMEIFYDDKSIKDKFIYGMVSNSTYIGGVKLYDDNEIVLNDGVFECIFIKSPETPLELQTILTGLLTHDFSAKLFYTFKASQILISSAAEVSWTIDGEFGGKHTDVEIENNKQALEIIASDRQLKKQRLNTTNSTDTIDT
ncbi:MAG: diacylglycerol/lipid kinase family protein [Anaerotignaceae bacterium]